MRTKVSLHLFFALLAAVCCAQGALADNYALIMTIGDYHGGPVPLTGVKSDAKSARQIALSMGVPEGNIMSFHDHQLTLDGMRKVFDDFEATVRDNDQVFVYFSGHGERALVRDPEPRCAEALVTVEGNALFDYELEGKLKKISAKASRVVVFLDACHAGGATTRSLAATGYTPKFYAKGVVDDCQKPVNLLTRGITAGAKTPGSGANNFAYIAAARDNEVAFDNPQKGGIATRSWVACINGAARDGDGSGGLSAEEIRNCAQAKIDTEFKGRKDIAASHIAITGNSNMVLAFNEKAGAAPATAAGTAKSSNPVSNIAVVNALATLRDIYNGRDDRRVVTLQPTKSMLKIGKDAFEFTLNSSHDGHVYVLQVGSDGSTFNVLFPNTEDTSNTIRAGESLTLPRQTWRIVSQGPPGRNQLLAIVADSPRDFAKAGFKPSGIFSEVAANPVSTKDIQKVTIAAPGATAAECAGARTLEAKRACSNAYGAAMVAIDESN